jgi:vacuolar-type H+-ATPase subunit I/STV1
VGYLSPQYLIHPGGPNFHFVWPAVLFFLLMGMLATTYAYFVEETNNKRAPMTRMARRVQSICWTLAVIGLILIGFRVGDARIPLVGSRLLLYIVALGFVGALAYVLYFLRFVLPQKNAAYELTLLRRQYQPRTKRRR